jgi:hypothetical protein
MSMTLIAHTELTGTQASIEFTSIPSTFSDLKLVVSGRSTADEAGLYAFDNMSLLPNGSSSNISVRNLLTLVGFGVFSNTDTTLSGGAANGVGATASTFANVEIYIPNYRSSNNKSWSYDAVTESNGSFAYLAIGAGLWSQTTAISSLTLDLKNGSFVQYSSATLYGITAGSDGTTVVS